MSFRVLGWHQLSLSWGQQLETSQTYLGMTHSPLGSSFPGVESWHHAFLAPMHMQNGVVSHLRRAPVWISIDIEFDVLPSSINMELTLELLVQTCYETPTFEVMAQGPTGLVIDTTNPSLSLTLPMAPMLVFLLIVQLDMLAHLSWCVGWYYSLRSHHDTSLGPLSLPDVLTLLCRHTLKLLELSCVGVSYRNSLYAT